MAIAINNTKGLAVLTTTSFHKGASRPFWFVTLLLLACFAALPMARATCQEDCLANDNTALGDDALSSLTGGENNTAMGFNALFSNTDGDNCTAVGWLALQSNTEGLANTAIGSDAMRNNTTGKANVAVGMFSLFTNSTGFRNVAIGTESLKRVNGFDNIGLGYEAGMNINTGSFTICIGNPGVSGDNNTIRIGTTGVHTSTNIAGISGAVVPNGVAVIVDTDGKLGTIVSSAAFKDEVKPMDKASEAILSLQPVSFRYKKELDPTGMPQFGLVAEDVAKIDPDLVACDEEGKPYTVRYEAINAMLLNEFLKEHRKVEKQEATIVDQQKQISDLRASLQAVNKRIDALTVLANEEHEDPN